MTTPKSRAICIIGMHRSGTSVITRAINILGAYVGEPHDLLPPMADNPEGFWEFRQFVDLQDKILETFGFTWSHFGSLPADWTRFAIIRPYREQLKEIIALHFADKQLWTWKDPRTSLLLPLWQEILEELDIELSYVYAFRNPLDVMASLQKRDGFTQEMAESTWMNYTESALLGISKAKAKTAFIQYDHFLNEPVKCLNKIVGQLELEVPFAIDSQLLDGILKPGLRHSYSTYEDLLKYKEGTSKLIDLYQLCLRAEENPASIYTEHFQGKIQELQAYVLETSHFRPHYEMQIFWKNESGDFTEECSLNLPIQGMLMVQRYSCALSSGTTFPLRIDPINVCAACEILSISLVGVHATGERTRLYSSADNHFAGLELVNGILLATSKSYWILGTTDPQIYLNIPHPEETYDYFELHIEMSVTLELTPYLTEMIHQAYTANAVKLVELLETWRKGQEEIAEKTKEISQIVQKNYQLGMENDALNSDIVQVKHQNVTLNLNLERLKQENIELLAAVERGQQQVERGQRQIDMLRDELEANGHAYTELSDTLAREQERFWQLSAELSETKKELAYIKGSRSWRWLGPVRRCAAILRKTKIKLKLVVMRILGERQFELLPLHNLVRVEGDLWQATGNDPQFQLVSGSIRGGWKGISFLGQSTGLSLALKLYYDQGEGMNEENAVTLGVLQKDYSGSQHLALRLPDHIKVLRLDPGDQEARFVLSYVKMRHVSQAELLLKSFIKFFQQYGLSLSTFQLLLQKVSRAWRSEGWEGIMKRGNSLSVAPNHAVASEDHYEKFIESGMKNAAAIDKMKRHLSEFKYKPLISILVPIYNVEEIWLRKCIESVVNQVYPRWELCLIDDCSPAEHIRAVLQEYQQRDKRIKVLMRETNGHICAASNDALKLATGDYIALLDHDDELTCDALYENVSVLNQYRDADVIYSDEDKINIDGTRHSPYFKPDWSPDMLLSQMYTCHLSVYRRELVEEVGGFRPGFEGSQDFDLMLRVSEKTNRIYHIPKVLYHWRVIPQSTASGGESKSYTHEAGLRAIEEAIARRNLNAWVEGVEQIPNLYRVHYRAVDNPKISIIIPNKNMASTLEQCIASIFQKSTYTNFEVIVVDNGSDDPLTFALYDQWKVKEPERFKMIAYNIPFNYSKLNNYAVQFAAGSLLLLLNNDIEVISSDWLEEMAGQAIRPEIGAVGANLVYPDHTIQHAGVVLGIGGVAGHSHKHFDHQDYGYFSRLKMVSNYSAVTAACLMVRKEVFAEVNGLEEELQVAFNDVDFCLKIRSRGYYNVWLPQVQLYHFESKSRGFENTPEKQQRFHGEIVWMRNRWAKQLDRDQFYNPNLSNVSEDFSLGKPYVTMGAMYE